jgi:hypothetical protein
MGEVILWDEKNDYSKLTTRHWAGDLCREYEKQYTYFYGLYVKIIIQI